MRPHLQESDLSPNSRCSRKDAFLKDEQNLALKNISVICATLWEVLETMSILSSWRKNILNLFCFFIEK